MYQTVASYIVDLVKLASMTKPEALKLLTELEKNPELQKEVGQALKHLPAKDAAVNPMVKNILMALALIAPAAMANPAQVGDLVIKKGPSLINEIQRIEDEVSKTPVLQILKKDRLESIKKELIQNRHDTPKLVNIITKFENELGEQGIDKTKRKIEIKKLLTEVNLSPSVQTQVMKA